MDLNNDSAPPSGWESYKRLLTYLRAHWLIFLASILGFLLYASTQTAFAKWMELVVNAIEAGKLDERGLIALAVIGIFIVRGIGGFFGNYCIAYVARSLVFQLRTEMFSHLLRLPSQYFQKYSSGELLAKLTYNVERVTGAATDAIKTLVREGLTIIGLLAYLFYLNWKLTLIFFAAAPLIALVVAFASKRFRTISHRIQNLMGVVTSTAQEAINGYQVIKTFGAHESEEKRFNLACKKDRQQQMKMVVTAAVSTPAVQLLVAAALATLMYLAMHPDLMAQMSTGEFIAFITAAGMLTKPLRQITSVNNIIQQGIAASQSIFELLDEPPEKDSGSLVKQQIQGELAFNGVNFRYPGANEAVLKDLNFKVAPGQSIALVGRSGSGKSTITHLIPRFYDINEGEIKLDGERLDQYQLHNLREHIALVNQQVVLFNGSIAENIAYGSLANHSDAEVRAAADAAHVMEFAEKLPEGLNTLVGENGTLLSGGQRQRIAIARALLKNATILILDEATSALDTTSERHIQAALEAVMKDRTTIVIAHRLSTVENVDQILVIDQGQVIERGTHRELLDKEGAYAQLYHKQFKEKQKEE